MRINLAFTCFVLAGCVGDIGPCDPAPRWQVPYTSESSLHVNSDGTLLVWNNTQLQRIGVDGQVIASLPLGQSNGGPTVAADEMGAPAIQLCSFTGSGAITVYDTSFVARKTLALTGCVQHLARGSAGQLAYASGNTTTTTQVHAVDASGTELWAVPDPLDGTLAFAPNGNVVLYSYQAPDGRRVELDAATGATVGDVILPLEPQVYYPQFGLDGSYTVRTYDRVDPVGVIRRDATGTDVWARPLRSLIGSPVIAPGGSVVVTTQIATQVVRLDAATGATIASTAHCTAGTSMAAATDDAYLMRDGTTLASYSGP